MMPDYSMNLTMEGAFLGNSLQTIRSVYDAFARGDVPCRPHGVSHGPRSREQKR